MHLVSPGKDRALETAARRVLPLRLAGQLLAGPARVSLGVLVGDVRHGMILALGVVAQRPPRMAPIGAGHIGPPAAWIVQRHGVGRGLEHRRSRDQQSGVGVRVLGGVGRPLGQGRVTGCLHEEGEVRDRDRPAVDPKAADGHLL